MVVGSFHFLLGGPPGSAVLTVANSLVFDAVEIVLLGGVGHEKQHRDDTSHGENQHGNSIHFASSFRKNNKSSFQSFRVGTRILLQIFLSPSVLEIRCAAFCPGSSLSRQMHTFVM